MFSYFYRQLPKAVGSVTLLVLLACLIGPQVAFSMEAPFDEKALVAQEKTFSGFNEVISPATSVAARIAEAEAQVQQAVCALLCFRLVLVIACFFNLVQKVLKRRCHS